MGEYDIVHLLASEVGCCVTYRAIYDRLHYEGFIAGVGENGYRVNVRGMIRDLRRSSFDAMKVLPNSKTLRVSATMDRAH